MRTQVSIEMTVNQAIQRWPQTLEVFTTFGIDSCCGGALPIAEVIRRHQLDGNVLLDQLNAVVNEVGAALEVDPVL